MYRDEACVSCVRREAREVTRKRMGIISLTRLRDMIGGLRLCVTGQVFPAEAAVVRRDRVREREEKAGSLFKVTKLCGRVGELPASIKASLDQSLL